MKLPIQEAPSYNITLPLSKKEVNFRPFLVKEQKLLLMAREGENAKEIFDAIEQVISMVTDSKVSAKSLPMADLEYLFLQVRARSVGETADMTLYCQEDGCEGTGPAKVNLVDVQVKTENLPDNRIKISDNLMIELRYPQADDAVSLDGLDDLEAVKPMLVGCMEKIYDDEEIYDLADHPDSEIEKFVDSLTMNQFEIISEWFVKLPVLSEQVPFVCETCKTKQEVELKGIQNFV